MESFFTLSMAIDAKRRRYNIWYPLPPESWLEGCGAGVLHTLSSAESIIIGHCSIYYHTTMNTYSTLKHFSYLQGIYNLHLLHSKYTLISWLLSSQKKKIFGHILFMYLYRYTVAQETPFAKSYNNKRNYYGIILMMGNYYIWDDEHAILFLPIIRFYHVYSLITL